MFSQFFVDPLLLPDAVEREMNAIESEFQLNVNSDGCRWQELLCFSSKVCKGEQQHPFGKFSWGNLQSLRDTPSQQEVNVMDELRRFYEQVSDVDSFIAQNFIPSLTCIYQYYYAANQRLVVIGAYSLDELQSQVEKCFSDVPAQPRQESTSLKINHVNPLSWTDSQYLPSIAAFGMPFPPESLARIYRIVPIKERYYISPVLCITPLLLFLTLIPPRHSLSITWQLPPAPKNNWKSKPEHIISHLLGHESKGSLLSSLKMKGWVTSCSAGISSDGHDVSRIAVVHIRLNDMLTFFSIPRMRHPIGYSICLLSYQKQVSIVTTILYLMYTCTLECCVSTANLLMVYPITFSTNSKLPQKRALNLTMNPPLKIWLKSLPKK